MGLRSGFFADPFKTRSFIFFIFPFTVLYVCYGARSRWSIILSLSWSLPIHRFNPPLKISEYICPSTFSSKILASAGPCAEMPLPYPQLSSLTCIHFLNPIWTKPLFVTSPYSHLILSFKHIKHPLIRENHTSPLVHTEISMLLTPGHSFSTIFCTEPLFLQFRLVFVTQFLQMIEDLVK